MKAAILICSDRSFNGERKDQTGPAIKQFLREHGWAVTKHEVLPDDIDQIAFWLDEQSGSGSFDVIVTSGGTGVAPRDITPEATLKVIKKRVPGMEEAMRARSLEITPHAMLSRGVVGTVGRTMIINLPGSVKGAIENLEIVLPALPHAVALLRGEHPDP
ncbi:MogA/MoaB family molybdenum cofactor biosynthesis protein [bacterium]|nr:MogA/MoaB family molybdenum cofactor biosynthesis protein [bacterium]MBU1651216.1 MogA/MoaB family molybdenum cofactor biosynthesis protein [bacterium]MBU1882128.1 MogA/MoaB family molybdenum cofactor biosynthesis protein [bacterium]